MSCSLFHSTGRSWFLLVLLVLSILAEANHGSSITSLFSLIMLTLVHHHDSNASEVLEMFWDSNASELLDNVLGAQFGQQAQNLNSYVRGERGQGQLNCAKCDIAHVALLSTNASSTPPSRPITTGFVDCGGPRPRSYLT